MSEEVKPTRIDMVEAAMHAVLMNIGVVYAALVDYYHAKLPDPSYGGIHEDYMNAVIKALDNGDTTLLLKATVDATVLFRINGITK